MAYTTIKISGNDTSHPNKWHLVVLTDDKRVFCSGLPSDAWDDHTWTDRNGGEVTCPDCIRDLNYYKDLTNTVKF